MIDSWRASLVWIRIQSLLSWNQKLRKQASTRKANKQTPRKWYNWVYNWTEANSLGFVPPCAVKLTVMITQLVYIITRKGVN